VAPVFGIGAEELGSVTHGTWEVVARGAHPRQQPAKGGDAVA
jgi:hypothetical protein